jgi:hypothetical protein
MCIVALPDAGVPGEGTRFASIVPCVVYVFPDVPAEPTTTDEKTSDPLPSGTFCCPALNSHVDVPTVTMNPYDWRSAGVFSEL